MIPTITHRIWLGSNIDTVEYLKSCVDSIKILNGWQHNLWTEKDIVLAFGQDYVNNVKMKFEYYNLQSDIYRMRILHEFGGFYLDCDCEVLQNFIDWCDTDFICNIDLINDMTPTIDRYFFGCNRGNELVKLLHDKSVTSDKRNSNLQYETFLLKMFSDTVLCNLEHSHTVLSRQYFNKFIKHYANRNWMVKET